MVAAKIQVAIIVRKVKVPRQYGPKAQEEGQRSFLTLLSHIKLAQLRRRSPNLTTRSTPALHPTKTQSFYTTLYTILYLALDQAV